MLVLPANTFLSRIFADRKQQQKCTFSGTTYRLQRLPAGSLAESLLEHGRRLRAFEDSFDFAEEHTFSYSFEPSDDDVFVAATDGESVTSPCRT